MTTRQIDLEKSGLDRITQQTSAWFDAWLSDQNRALRRMTVGAILTLALVAFELFNFDTTEYALENLLGIVSFGGVRWATILAIAFCSIDFAGLARLIMPDEGRSQNPFSARPNWLILGAWLMGGAMNAIMSWWAVSLALMNHNLGNELLSRAQLLHVVPVLIAILVWMTRILIISSFVTAADHRLVTRSTELALRRQPVRNRQRPSLPIGPPRREPIPVLGASSVHESTRKEETDRQPPFPHPTGRSNGRPANNPVVPRAPRSGRPKTVPLHMRRNPTGRRQAFS